MDLIANFIGGEFHQPVSGKYLDNVEPATGMVYSQIPDSSSEDLQLAVAAAEKAQQRWAAMLPEKRAEILTRLADAIDANADDLARAETIDNGKPIQFARSVDIYRASANIRFFAQAITQFASESHAMGELAVNYTLRDPIGIVGCISPWNFPLYLLTWKIAPALAAGNVVIAKPSEVTPMTAYLFSKLCNDAGLPKGVLNLVHGRGADIGAKLTTHEKVKAISFTGGSQTGAAIAAATASQFKKLSLELGGKNPTVVFADCDFEDTVTNAVRAAFSNQGQICLCGSRIYIEDSLYEKFRDAFVAKVRTLKIGDPLEESTGHGALVSKAHMNKVLDYIALAKSEGGTLLTGGERKQLSGRCENGFFVEPTVFEGLANNCRTNQEEIFGPVCTLQKFSTDEEAVELANGTQFGLSASVWSNDVKRCHRMAKDIQAGIVWINCWMVRDLRTPFGGVKSSGVGREGGLEALRFFTEPKNVCIKY